MGAAGWVAFGVLGMGVLAGCGGAGPASTADAEPAFPTHLSVPFPAHGQDGGTGATGGSALPTAPALSCPYSRYFVPGALAIPSNVAPITHDAAAGANANGATGCTVKTYDRTGRLTTEEHTRRDRQALDVRGYDADGALTYARVSSYDDRDHEQRRTESWGAVSRTETWSWNGAGQLGEDDVQDDRQMWVTRDVYDFDFAQGRVQAAHHFEGTSFQTAQKQTDSTYAYDGGTLSAVVVSDADGGVMSQTSYSYFDSGARSGSRWETLAGVPRSLTLGYDRDGHLLQQTSTSGAASQLVGTDTRFTWVSGLLGAEDMANVGASAGAGERTRYGYDSAGRVTLRIVERTSPSGTSYAATRYVRDADGNVARVELDADGDCNPDGWIEYTRGSADGELVEQNLGTAAASGRRTFTPECAVDLEAGPAPSPWSR